MAQPPPPKELVANADLTDAEHEQLVRQQQDLWDGLDRKAKQTAATNGRIAQARLHYEDEYERLHPRKPHERANPSPRRLPL